MATPHNSAEPGDFAPHVIMPGDPRRAKAIAETYFDSPRLVTEVRGILGYTGTVNGEPISVMASGMGMPSMSIYATELARFYGVTRIVRCGTMGGLQDDIEVGDVVAAQVAHTDSAMTVGRIPGINFSHNPTYSLLDAAVKFGQSSGMKLHVGPVYTTDHFYSPHPELVSVLRDHGTLAVEMEAAALYAVGAAEGIETLTVGTVSDHLFQQREMTAAERESTFADMVAFGIAAIQS